MIIMKNNTKIAVVGVGGFVAGVLVDRIITERNSKQIVEKMDELAQEDELQSEFKTENDTSSTESDTDEKKGDETNE